MANTEKPRKETGVNEMRMPRWMCGVTKADKIRNEHVRGSLKVAPMPKKITEKTLKWYGHVKRRDEGACGKKNVRCTSTRNETERKTENQVERLV